MATRSGSHLIISKPKPTLCKVVDYMANPGESKCFIKNPDYGEVTAKMLQAYTFVPQKNAYNPNFPHYDGIESNTDYIVDAAKDVIKEDSWFHRYAKELLETKGINLDLYDDDEVFRLCDKLLINGKLEEFELLYHYGNLNFEKYLANSDLLPRYFIKYISDVTRDSHLEGVSTLLESMTLEEIKKLVCTRKLKLTDSQQKKIYCIKILDGSPVIEKNDAIFLETLFSLGAISLTQVQAMRIIRYAGYESIAPQIAKVAKGSLPDFHLVNVNEYPFKDKDCYEEAMKQIRTKMVDQKLAEIEEREKERTKEAEDEMDKIFAEAQKNIEMER